MAKKPVRTVFNVPSFNLRELTHSDFAAWSVLAADQVREPHEELSAMAKDIGGSRKGKLAVIHYVLTAYETALAWEQNGEARELIFAAFLLQDPLAFRKELDIFSAALRLGTVGTERPFSLRRSAKACKFAWLNHWAPWQFGYEIYCAGIAGVAKRWTEVSTTAALNASSNTGGMPVVAAS